MNTGQEKQTKTTSRDFFCGPVIKTSPSNTGDAYLIPGQVAKILHTFWPHKKTKKNPPPPPTESSYHASCSQDYNHSEVNSGKATGVFPSLWVHFPVLKAVSSRTPHGPILEGFVLGD